MKFKIVILLMNLTLFSCKDNDIGPMDLANHIIEKNENQKSFSYDVDYRIKFFNQEQDTTKIFAKIDLIRQENDTIFGGYVWIKSDSIERYYDTNNTYFINHREKSIERYPKEDPGVITTNVVGSTIETYFLKPDRLINAVADTSINITLLDKELNGKKHWQLSYKYEDDERYYNTWKNIWFDKEKYFVSKMNFSSNFQETNQYNQWDLANIKYNNVSIDDLKKRFDRIKRNYVLEDYKERSSEELALLSNGQKIPGISGTRYSDRSPISLNDYRGKVVLIDFWYMDCPPCIKAIPHLNDIQNKYKEQGLVVVGINPYNDNEKDLKRMPKFLSYNSIDYPIMFVDKNKTDEFKINVYPSFYLIDKQGNILHSEIGFNEEATNKLDSLIQVNL